MNRARPMAARLMNLFVECQSLQFKSNAQRIICTSQNGIAFLFPSAFPCSHSFPVSAQRYYWSGERHDLTYNPPLPPPISMLGKMARFGFSVSSSLIRGKGWFYFLFYSVQDCSCCLCCCLNEVCRSALTINRTSKLGRVGINLNSLRCTKLDTGKISTR